MPPCPPPNSILSRVVLQVACLASLTSGMPNLANSPFSLATISGEESVRAIKPKVALVVSGASAVAAQAPPGTRLRAAVRSAALPAPLRMVRRFLMLWLMDFLPGSIFVGKLQPEDGLVRKAAKRHPRTAIVGIFRQQRGLGVDRQFQ